MKGVERHRLTCSSKIYQRKESKASVLVRLLKFSGLRCPSRFSYSIAVVLFSLDLVGLICLTYNVFVWFYFVPLCKFNC